MKLKGFLCYKDEQEIGFDDNATLWMLSGLNGSGKSSIFDAVTFALFGHHRGGGQQPRAYQQGQRRPAVEFDFLLDGKAIAPTDPEANTRGGAHGSPSSFYRIDTRQSGIMVAVGRHRNQNGFNKWIRREYWPRLRDVHFLRPAAPGQGRQTARFQARRSALCWRVLSIWRHTKAAREGGPKRKELKDSWICLSDQLEILPGDQTGAGIGCRGNHSRCRRNRQQAMPKSIAYASLEIKREPGWTYKTGSTSARTLEARRTLLDEDADIRTEAGKTSRTAPGIAALDRNRAIACRDTFIRRKRIDGLNKTAVRQRRSSPSTSRPWSRRGASKIRLGNCCIRGKQASETRTENWSKHRIQMDEAGEI